MIATETSPNQKPAVRSVPVHLTAHRLRRVKIEPQETAVTMAAKTEPSQQGLAAQTISLQGTEGLTGSRISSASPGQGGQQTFSIGNDSENDSRTVTVNRVDSDNRQVTVNRV